MGQQSTLYVPQVRLAGEFGHDPPVIGQHLMHGEAGSGNRRIIRILSVRRRWAAPVTRAGTSQTSSGCASDRRAGAALGSQSPVIRT